MSAPEHKSDIGKRLDEARLGMTHGIDVLLQQAKAEIEQLEGGKNALQAEIERLRELNDIMEIEIAQLRAAAARVCRFSWDDNDDDAVEAIDELRRVLDGEKQ